MGMKLTEKVFVDAHDYQGTMTIIATLSGDANELDKEYLCTALLEPYMRKWGFSIRNLKCMNKCFYDVEHKRVTRSFVYEKWYPPRYKGIFFNQKYTPEVKREVERLRGKAQGYMKTNLDIG